MELKQQCLQPLPELALAVATEGSAALLWGLEALGARAGPGASVVCVRAQCTCGVTWMTSVTYGKTSRNVYDGQNLTNSMVTLMMKRYDTCMVNL